MAVGLLRERVGWTGRAGRGRWPPSSSCAAWFAYNVRYTAQDVYATRDPARYTITARWLVDHRSLLIQTHPDVFGSPTGWRDRQRFLCPGRRPDRAQRAGQPSAAGVLGCRGRSSGRGRCSGPISCIGALALFVLFGLRPAARRRPLALLVTVVLAVSMPYLYVARDNYTEPLTMLVPDRWTGAAASRMSRGRGATSPWPGWSAARAAMVRVDSYCVLIGLVAAAACMLALAPAERLASGPVPRARAACRGSAPFGRAGLARSDPACRASTTARQHSQHHPGPGRRCSPRASWRRWCVLVA